MAPEINARRRGPGDYELRDLNDETNKQMCEKRHWENQTVALGGTNYLRNVAMLNEDGKEVLGTKGYKCVYYSSPPVSLFPPYGEPLREEDGRSLVWLAANNFGCAKELSCVRELFQFRKTAKEEASAMLEF
ncbi:hypothetical protein K438DRAFT_2028722 [Mycena galopus ATCC 62051]|nr:hypothetical protein K438DRAFT_2028722 [Mycena galopus ATCC 62051]